MQATDTLSIWSFLRSTSLKPFWVSRSSTIKFPSATGGSPEGGGVHELGIFLEHAGIDLGLERLELLQARLDLFVGKLHVDGELLRVDRDDVAVLERCDRAADRRFRCHVPHDEAV